MKVAALEAGLLLLCHLLSPLSVTFRGLTFKTPEASPCQMTVGGTSHVLSADHKKLPFNTTSLPCPQQMAALVLAAHISSSMSQLTCYVSVPICLVGQWPI